jgi:hypothetical protein
VRLDHESIRWRSDTYGRPETTRRAIGRAAAPSVRVEREHWPKSMAHPLRIFDMAQICAPPESHPEHTAKLST